MGGRFYPDWAGIQTDPQDDLDQVETSQPPNILPGDSKLGRKWSSKNIEDGLVHPDHHDSDWMKPLRQIFAYCVRANARYGYIVTDEEVVVIRVHPILEPGDQGETNDNQGSRHESESSTRGQETVDSQASLPDLDEDHDFMLSSPVFKKVEANGRLEYRAVPWSNAASLDPRRSADLTVNLALWWLHIMASVSSNIKEQYAPLKEVAKPPCFRAVHSSFRLPEASANMRPNLPLRSRKRGSSAVSDKGTPSDDSEDKDPVEYERSKRNLKRVRTDDEDSQPRRQTRSMMSQN